MIWLVIFAFASVLPSCIHCQRVSFGRCPEVQAVSNFDMNEFAGEWVEIERSFYLFESPLSCTKVNFTMDQNSTDSLAIQVSYKAPWRNRMSTIKYNGEYKNAPGVINMKSEEVPAVLSRLAPGSGKYTVLQTDYSDFALIYSCTNFRLLHADFIWVLGRKKDLTATMRTVVYATLDKIGADRESLVLTRHECEK